MSGPWWFSRKSGLAIPIVHIPAYNQNGRQLWPINITDIIGEDNEIILENINYRYIQRQFNEYNKQKILSDVESCEKYNIDQSQH